ncbi:MAG: VWA domain-containing protein, partial [Haloferacaceae archaeon]
GALDLTVDWEEHYFHDTAAEKAGVDLRRSVDDLTEAEAAQYVGFPDPLNPLVHVHVDDVSTFMNNTTLESYPDAGLGGDDDADDGVQDDLSPYTPCDDFAQMSENLNPTNGRGEGKRTANPDTILNYDEFVESGGSAEVDVAPLVNLHDVKPGDFGELTLSLHLCDNPGYIWMQGELNSALENGHTEPESKDDDEIGGPESTNPDEVELLDEIQTMLWYDEDGDNVYEPAGEAGEVDVVIVVDNSGSMGSAGVNSGSKLANAKAGARYFVDAAGPTAQIGVVSFDGDADTEIVLTDVGASAQSIKNAIDGIPQNNGSTNIEDGVETGQSVLNGTNARSGASKIMILLSDGEPTAGTGTDNGQSPVQEAQTAKTAGTEIFTIGYGISSGSSFAQTLEDVASDPADSYAYLDVDVDTPQEVQAVFGQIGQIIAGEECFFQGSLRTLLELVTPDEANGHFGIPLDGVRGTGYEEITGTNNDSDPFVDADYAVGDGSAEARDAFVDCTTNAIGLAWWLPVDHANEIQSDSVEFNLGFYTEQCRHNDGSGQAPETTTVTNTTQA